jgi:hypothetical protein
VTPERPRTIRPMPEPRPSRPSAPARLPGAWRAMPAEYRIAVLAALGLFVSMFLPWYEKSYFAVVRGRPLPASDGLSAFQAFSFVEAAVLLVALGVIFLAFMRAEGRPFHLPGGDGTVIMAAGMWAGLLLVWRLFDKPGASAGNGAAVTVGIQWGIFFALAAAGLVTYAGYRVRAAHRPEPALPGEARRETRATEPLVRDQRGAGAPSTTAGRERRPRTRAAPMPPPAAPGASPDAPAPRPPRGEEKTVAMPGRVPEPEDPPEPPPTLF